MKYLTPFLLTCLLSGCLEMGPNGPTKPVDPTKPPIVNPTLSPLSQTIRDATVKHSNDLAGLANTIGSQTAGGLTAEDGGKAWNTGATAIDAELAAKLKSAVKAALEKAGTDNAAAQAKVWEEIAKGYQR